MKTMKLNTEVWTKICYNTEYQTHVIIEELKVLRSNDSNDSVSSKSYLDKEW